ncbi:MAG TPA: GNAT family N-acetyltransferase [Phycisphaerae bacterium]|nr:GNAT family N-acetyltransferase [Phycisphaerae bacterium]
MSIEEIISAVRRSERAWCEQLGMGESLEFGVAYASTAFPNLREANQLRDAWIADASPSDVYDKVEEYYRERGLVCRMWTPASGQAVEPVEALLLGKGWRRADLLAMGLVSRDTDGLMGDAESIRVLPARAMRRAYRASRLAASGGDETQADAGAERLNDSRYDAFVAVIEGEPVGRVGYLEAGEIGRLADLWVSPGHRGAGVDRALAAHFLQMARRLLPKYVVACVEASDADGRAILEQNGFAAAGELPRFVRNGA